MQQSELQGQKAFPENYHFFLLATWRSNNSTIVVMFHYALRYFSLAISAKGAFKQLHILHNHVTST